MKFTTFTLAAALVATTAFVTHTLRSQDAQGEGFDMAAMEDMMPSPPGEVHEHMALAVGRWNVAGKFFIPGMPPMEMEGVSTMEMVMDGRFLKESFESDWMGQPFRGQNITGYNVDADEYQSVWMDSTSTAMAYSSGTMRDDGVLELRGVMKDKMTPEGRKVRSELIHEGPEKTVVRMYDDGPDGGTLTMELVYTKA